MTPPLPIGSYYRLGLFLYTLESISEDGMAYMVRSNGGDLFRVGFTTILSINDRGLSINEPTEKFEFSDISN